MKEHISQGALSMITRERLAWNIRRLRAKVGRCAFLAGRAVQILCDDGLSAGFQRVRSAIRRKLLDRRTVLEQYLPQLVPAQTSLADVINLLDERWPAHRPMRSIRIPKATPRVSIVTCSVGHGSMFGGVGTSLVLGALLANRLGAGLRLITRSEPPNTDPLRDVLKANGIVLEGECESAFAPSEGGREVPIAPSDIFLSTAWWSTRSLLQTIPRSQLVSIVQEDERLFYNYSDDRLLCAETLEEGGFPVVVNTEQLYRHLIHGPEPLTNLQQDGLWFEPAFPGTDRPRTPRAAGAKRRFFFYARPGVPRNLFWRGIEALAAAIEKGILPAEDWEFHWVGMGILPVSLPCGAQPIVSQCLAWTDYQSLVRSMDAGLTLMYTPHPSYPPLDLAASGAAVLTNEHPGKADLSRYSSNILTAKPAMASLLEGLERLAKLAHDDEARAANRAADHISRDWATSFEPVVQRLADRFTEHRAGRRAA